MGDKTEARRRMRGGRRAGGAGRRRADHRSAVAAARCAGEMGYPVMVKAAAGGGGKGMRVVRAGAELDAALATAASEALKAFGDASVYIEKFIERPRHVEIQVLADATRDRPPRRAGVLGAAAAPEGGRGGALGRGGPGAPRTDGRGGGGGRGRGGLPERGHLRVPARRRRQRSTSSR